MPVRRFSLLLSALLVAGCAAGGGSPSPTGAAPAAQSAASLPATAAATPPATTATPAPTPAPSPTPGQPGVTVVFHSDVQHVLVSASTGRRIFVDVANPTQVDEIADRDILLTTHLHGDHYSADFVAKFPGKKLTAELGSIDLPDVKVTAIASYHADDDVEGSDYIFVIETDGLRIGEFGDCGQSKLTAAQLQAIGKLDVMFQQSANGNSDVDEINQKALKIVGQVKPLLWVPLHTDQATTDQAVAQYGGSWTVKPVTITKAKLPAKTTLLMLNNMADVYGPKANLPAATL